MPAADLALLGAASARSTPTARRHRRRHPRRPIVAVGDDAEVRARRPARTEVIDRARHRAGAGPDRQPHPPVPRHGRHARRRPDRRCARSTRCAPRCGPSARAARPATWVLGYALAYEAFPDGGIDADAIEDAVRRRARAASPSSTSTRRSPAARRCAAPASTARARSPRRRGRVRRRRADGRAARAAARSRSCASAVPEPTDAERLRRYADDARAHERRRPHRRPRDDRVAAAARGVARAGGARRPDGALRRAAAARAGHRATTRSRRCSPLRDRGGRRWRGGPAKFFIDGVVETGTALAVRARHRRRGHRAVLARPRPLRRGGRALRARRLPVRHPRDRRPRGARRRSTPTAPPARAAARRTASSTSRRCTTTTCRGSRPRASARRCSRCTWRASTSPTVQLARPAGAGAPRPAFRCRDIRRSGAILALGSDWPVARFDPRLGLGWAGCAARPGHPERGRTAPTRR